jgi:hypothetical protein
VHHFLLDFEEYANILLLFLPPVVKDYFNASDLQSEQHELLVRQS